MTELDSIENELVERATSAREAVCGLVPEARPGPETCGYCWVRHMCDEYWRSRIGQESASRSFTADIELAIAGVTDLVVGMGASRLLIPKCLIGACFFAADQPVQTLEWASASE